MKLPYAAIKWENNEELFNKWKQGMTGCPIVDAAMRHLNTTGYMPNRLRMVVANYLVKDLLIDWRKGEQYFATKLVDYDPSQNSGGWQWAAGCGTDSQPFFRIFNPKLQSQKFDTNCEYILKWIPELKGVKINHIHDWEENYKLYKDKKLNYPDPIVKHSTQKEKCLKMFKTALYGDNDDSEEAKDNYYDDSDNEPKKRKDYDGKENPKGRKVVKKTGKDDNKTQTILDSSLAVSAKKKKK